MIIYGSMKPLDIVSLIPVWNAVQYGIKQGRDYTRRRQVLDVVEDAIKTTTKLRPPVVGRLAEDFRTNKRIRDDLLSANSQLEILMSMNYYSSERLPYKELAPDVAAICTA